MFRNTPYLHTGYGYAGRYPPTYVLYIQVVAQRMKWHRLGPVRSGNSTSVPSGAESLYLIQQEARWDCAYTYSLFTFTLQFHLAE